MFSRPEEDLVRLDTGHPHILAALAFEGPTLMYLEASWLDGLGLPDQVDAASLERLLIAARAAGYQLSVRSRVVLRESDGSFRERFAVDIENPDPADGDGAGLTIHLHLGFDPALATDAWPPEQVADDVQTWGDRALASVRARFPRATVDFSPEARGCMEIEVQGLRGQRLTRVNEVLIDLVDEAADF